jgi:UDPglucose 6-dehydrogenase
MNISVVGTGYVGLVQGVGMAEKGHRVVCVDIDEEKVEKMKRAISPIYEPGLEELMKKNIDEGRLFFTTNLTEAIKQTQVVFIAVGTPQGKNGEADLSQVYTVAHEIGQVLDGYKVIVNKSTVPVGTSKKVKEIISEYYSDNIDIVSNPEFLREGLAVRDFLFPDRIILGVNPESPARIILEEVYRKFDCPKVFTVPESSELIKYASNAFLATKISFINEIAGICEKVGADVKEVAHGMGLDKRIGDQFLDAGIGYGGSCFPKDTRALHQISNINNNEFKILKAVIEVNNNQKKLIKEKIKNSFPDMRGKTFAVWGLSFKPDTDDVRESPAINLIRWLVGRGAKIKACDPIAISNAKNHLPHDVEYFDSPYDAAQGADGVVVITDWSHFKEIDKNLLKEVLGENNIFDGRNIFDPKEMKELGFNYHGIGRRIW